MAIIYLVEDDPILGRSLCLSLESQKYQFEWMRDLKSAREMIQTKKNIDLLLLDLNLPDGHGLDFLDELRRQHYQFPVVILTANTHEDSVVQGLEKGASDYIRKPFGTRELLARIQNVLKESKLPNQFMRYGDLQIFPDHRKILFNGESIELKRREFEILCYFVKHAEAVITREGLLDAISNDEDIFDRTIDSHISKIRQQLRNAGVMNLQISSIYGVGYKLEKI